MRECLLHSMPPLEAQWGMPDKMVSPYRIPPHPLAQAAAAETIEAVHDYMAHHSQSELHRLGKMFGVLVVQTEGRLAYLRAFSAMLDGERTIAGFVPPVFEGDAMPIGHNRAESQRLQRLIFSQYWFANSAGEKKNLLDIFAHEKQILSEEEFFAKSQIINHKSQITNPPSGAGECCAPKLLQYALSHGLKPLALAEFWVGAPPRNELRREGCFYPPCSGRCRPILRWMLGAESVESTPANEWRIDVLYEDEWLMLVNKPAGLLSVPGKSDELSLIEVLNQKSEIKNLKFLQPVHRLDQDTSGLLVLAKTPEVYKTLQAYFQRRDILKRYEAVVDTRAWQGTDGFPDEGDIRLPLLPNPFDRPRQMVDEAHGKPAETHYCVRERRADGTAVVDFYPRTGRTHQLRVHAAHPDGLNAPIVGDRLYGTPADRLFLHAAEIRFVHPVTGQEMHWNCHFGRI